jgi:hypothetical protein
MYFAPAYAQGVQTALAELRLEKNAGIFSRPAAYLSELGTAAEKALYSRSRKHLSPAAQQTLKKYVGGVASNTLQETAANAALGGVIGGGLQAAFAEPGEGVNAGLRGVVPGVLGGAAWGAVSGPTRALMRNATRQHLEGRAIASKIHNPAAAAKKLVDTDSWWQNVKDSVTSNHPMGRTAPALAALSGTAAMGLADFYLPSKLNIMGMSEPPEAPPPSQQSRVVTASHKKDHSKVPIEVKGSSLGSISSNITTKALIRTHKFPFQAKLHPFALEVAPVLITAAGGFAGYAAAKKLERHLSTSKKK